MRRGGVPDCRRAPTARPRVRTAQVSRLPHQEERPVGRCYLCGLRDGQLARPPDVRQEVLSRQCGRFGGEVLPIWWRTRGLSRPSGHAKVSADRSIACVSVGGGGVTMADFIAVPAVDLENFLQSKKFERTKQRDEVVYIRRSMVDP